MVTVVLPDHLARAVLAAVIGNQAGEQFMVDSITAKTRMLSLASVGSEGAQEASDQVEWHTERAEVLGEARAILDAAVSAQAAPLESIVLG